MKLRMVPSSNRDSSRRSAFTLVEILVVIGIIAVILSIALPVTFKARRQASKAKATRDLGALATALDEFKNNNNEYPQIYYPYLGTLTTDPRNAKTGQNVLYCALTGKDMQGNAITNAKSGRPTGSMINVESFRVNDPNARNLICDSNTKPYLYFVASVPEPDIASAANGGMFVRDYTGGAGPPLYTHSYCGNLITLEHMRYLLGDGDKAAGRTPNGYIDSGDVPSTKAPYLLWAAGPDGIYGLDANGKCDDATNFDIPAEYVR
jgi:prepilin-type N-terminal cleavage/methylation domain-containing protein